MHPSFTLTLSALTSKSMVPFLRRYLREARPLLKAPLRELHVVLIADRRMSELHDRFMNLPTPTDVLTFPLDEDPRGRPITGEVYVCVPEARRQAKRRGTPPAHEVLLYALHGMLHLCGFDDRTDAEFRRMHRAEDRILTRLGIGNVFRVSRAARPCSLPGTATTKTTGRPPVTRR